MGETLPENIESSLVQQNGAFQIGHEDLRDTQEDHEDRDYNNIQQDAVSEAINSAIDQENAERRSRIFHKSSSKQEFKNYEDKQSIHEIVNETLKNCSSQAEIKIIDLNKRQDDKRNSRRMSNYLHNIQMTNSSLGLTFKATENKDNYLLKDSQTVTRFSPLLKQTLGSSAPILLTFITGLTSGYSAILLPQLKNGTGPIPSDDDTASWIAAMAALPMAPGCLVSGWMMEKFGRRTSQYITCIPLLLGWIFIACSYNLGLMLIGRFFTGLCAGLLGPLVAVYIGEITEPRYRGFFLASISLAIALGILAAHAIGTFMTWQWTAIICGSFPILSIFLLTFIPESPSWLITQGRIDDGIKAFYWLRGYGEEAKMELKGILDTKKSADNEPRMNLKEKLRSLKSPELIKPLFIMILFFMTCQFSGVNAVAFYSIEIVEKAVGKAIDHYLTMLIIDSLRVVMSIVACVICKQYGRRPLCFISGIWTALSMIGLAMFLYFKPENMAWLPLICLMFYICAISIGLVPLPWIMCGEVFPAKLRGLGSGISSATTFVSFFVVVKTAPGMMTNFGEVVTFLTYGVIALFGTALMYFILPETKGKSLREIEERFKRGKKSDVKIVEETFTNI
ncbi:unnamed protein product [Arctia plantaginis]|uniref:Major facilitator superfamily (MFS) profile domain-containing protein n=1 Tax=Arctia plantaginis TaxID=874455 RepID=A0A8S1BJD6_ARCPL|nr:unnamed protein product [Arctia plantaginis]